MDRWIPILQLSRLRRPLGRHLKRRVIIEDSDSPGRLMSGKHQGHRWLQGQTCQARCLEFKKQKSQSGREHSPFPQMPRRRSERPPLWIAMGRFSTGLESHS